MCQVDLMKLRVKCQTPEEPAAVFVKWKKKGELAVCAKCWEKIAVKDWECGDDSRPTFESLFSDEAKGLVGAVPYEYLGKGLGVKKSGTEEIEKEEKEDEIEEAEQ